MSVKLTKELGCTRFVCAGSIMEYEVEAAIHSQGYKARNGLHLWNGQTYWHIACVNRLLLT